MENERDRPISFPDIKAALEKIAVGGVATTAALYPAKLLRFWLWGCDANEVCDKSKCEFHLCHLTGMVAARVLTEAYSDDPKASVLDHEDMKIIDQIPSLFLPHFHTDEISKRSIVPERVTLQQLHDIVHSIQMQWPVLKDAIENSSDTLLPVVERLIVQLFIWFGGYLYSTDIQPLEADDMEFVDNVPAARDRPGVSAATRKLVLTDFGVKYYLNIFFVLFRLLFIQRHAVPVPVIAAGVHSFAIENFHVEASVDDFHMLGMYNDIPSGCLLEYKHSYSGFFNSVSQVVYRHFPAYKRRRPVTLSEVDEPDAPALTVLPPLKQIYPEIAYAFEDHHFQSEVAGVRSAVLLAEKDTFAAPVPTQVQASSQTPVARNLATTTGRCRRNIQPSSNITQRIAACTGIGNVSKDVAGSATDGNSVRIAEFSWFVIGGNIYLVRTSDGVSYSGTCRDLLSFYLSTRT